MIRDATEEAYPSSTCAEFFTRHLAAADLDVQAAVTGESRRQADGIELIASENIVSRAVMEAQGTSLTNKYAEGYPGRRYYGGCEFADHVEALAIKRAQQLFKCTFVNVQPHSGAQANGAVMLALLQPGDTILGMSLDAGGHLTHGARPALSGKWFHAVQHGVSPYSHRIDYDAVEALALESRPKMIIAGGSAIPRELDFARYRAIADRVDAYLMVDMAHIAGLVAAGAHPSPLPYADVVTTTTHKTLRGPRGGMILGNNPQLGKKVNSAVFPGLQGGPLMHVIAAKAVALGEALQPAFSVYIKRVVANARALAGVMVERGCDIVTGGTDTHLMLVDLRPKGLKGNQVEQALERAGITCNKNGIPFDPEKPTITSGIRLGTPAGTTRGFGIEEFCLVGHLISDVLDALQSNPEGDQRVEAKVREQVLALCGRFPLYR
ncbi:MAG: serine hydroxymethyltransferase [Haliea sp.]|uniref:serine hydroxymethyltransferase n=1 Tax=Haliea sp. TaxID=1932666 RepID=UPI0032EEDBC0